MKEHFIGIGQAHIESGKAVFVARALGSCIALAIYSPFTKVGGMAHVLLPSNNNRQLQEKKSVTPRKVAEGQVARRADEAVGHLVSEIERKNRTSYGDRLFVLRAKIAGGAELFPRTRGLNSLPMGPKNVRSVKEALKSRNIAIRGEDVGGNWGRNVYFYLDTAKMVVKKINGEIIEI